MAFQSKLTGAGVNDMCNMQELTKDTILNLLKDRFKKEIVYTYAPRDPTLGCFFSLHQPWAHPPSSRPALGPPTASESSLQLKLLLLT